MNNITIRNIDPQNISINGGGSVIGITKVYVNGRDVTDGSVAYVVVPTKTSELQNDSGFITTETDPTVPYYVKQINLSDISKWNSKQNQLISGSNIKTINNNSILGSGNLEIEGNTYTAGNGISISDSNVITNLITSYNSLSDKPTIPTKTSDLLNDSNFTTRSEFAQVAFSGSYLDLTDEPVIPQNTSDLYNDSGFITNSTNQLENYMLKSYLDTILPKTTSSGTSINLNDSAGTPLTISLAPSELSQDSTPTPSTPEDIHLITGNNSVMVEGKNLFDIGTSKNDYLKANDTIPTDEYSVSVSNNTLSMKIVSYGGTYIYRNKNYIGNTTYTISCNFQRTNGRLLIRLRNLENTDYLSNSDLTISGWSYVASYKGWYKEFTTTNVSITISIPNCLYWQLGLGYATGTDTGEIKSIADIQIEYGSTATTYTPYVSQTAPINLGNIEYCKIGNYSDEFYLATDSDTELESGKWYIKKKIGKYNGSDIANFEISNSYSTDTYLCGYNNNFASTDFMNTEAYCNYFDGKYHYATQLVANNIKMGNSSLGICVLKSDFANISSLNSFLSTNSDNIELYLVLRNPTYTLLDNTIQEQLNNITKNLMSYTPQTNIKQTNADLPFVISASTFKIIGG